MKSTTQPAAPNLELIDHLAQGGVVVTATRRQAALLRAEMLRDQEAWLGAVEAYREALAAERLN